MGYRPQEVKPQVSIRKLVLVESKKYKDMWLRPYEMHIGHDDVSNIENMVANVLHDPQHNGSSALKGMLNTGMPDILMPSAMVSEKANIIHGWNEKRFKFVLVVEMKQPGDNKTIINYIQGYTEYLGISASDHLDPNMRLFTNSVIKLIRTYDSITGNMNTVPVGNYNVVNDETNQTPNNYNSLKLARPADIAMNVASIKSLDDNDDIVTMSNVGSVNSHELVDKRSLLPNDHVADTIKMAIDSKLANGIYGNDGDVVDTMVGNLLTPSIYNIDFFKTILDISGQGNDFTIGQLELIEPNISNIIEVMMDSGISNYNIPNELLTEDTAETYDSSLESRMSVIVHEAVSALLNESILNNIVFDIDNYSGVPEGEVLDCGSYVEGLNLPMYANMFLSSFINRAWGSISNANNTQVKILVMGMVESDTTIIITLDGRHPITYRYPTFADSKFLPILMDNNKLDLMSEDYGTLIDSTLGTVSNAISRQTPIAAPQQPIYTGNLRRV